MKKFLRYIGIGVFLGWSVALLVNFSIYQHTTYQETWVHPVVDGILFMAVMLALYFGMLTLYEKKQAGASVALAVLGVFSILLAVFYFL
nr:hypothetical protein [Evansella caseinilytica]